MPQQHATTTPTGLRRLTPAMLATGQCAARFAGLEPGTRPGQILAAFKAAAPHAGIEPRLVHAIDWFFAWTKAIDWEPDSRPIVWPSAARQAEGMGLTLSQVKRLNRRLIETGLIVAVDGPGGCRRGERHKRTDKIIWAYGFDLSPLAVRLAEFQEIARLGIERRKLYDSMRRRYTIARKSLRMILNTALEESAAGAWSTYDDALSSIPRSWPTTDTDALNDLATAVSRLERLVTEAKEALESALISVERHPEGRIDAPLYNTNYKPSEYPIQDTVMAHKGSRLAVGSPRTDQTGRGGGEPKKASDQPERSASLKIRPNEVLKLAPKLHAYLDKIDPDWLDLIEAADRLRCNLGVSQPLWGDACLTLGREGAAVAIALVSTKPPGHFKSGPANYFFGMVKKAKVGELHLDRTIWGLRRHGHNVSMRH